MVKNVVKFLALVFVVLTLSACSSNAQESSNKYTSYEKGAGVFVGLYGDENIDIETKESKKMFSLSDEAKKSISSLSINDPVFFEYEQNSSGQLVIHTIEKVVGIQVDEKTIPVAETKPKEEKIKEQKKKEKKEKEKKEEEEGKSQFNIDIPKGVTLAKVENTEILTLDKDERFFISIENGDILEDIKKERWRAADTLNPVGNLKEIVNEQIPHKFLNDADFIFRGHNSTFTKIIAVKTVNGERIRFTLTYPGGEDTLTQNELWDVVSTIK